MRKYPIVRLAASGLLAALILLLTFAVRIPIPATGGYVHPGDGAVLYAGMLLGPYGFAAAGIGSALADLLGGYAIFALPTLVIKGGMGLLSGLLARPGAYARNALAFALAALWMAAGYFAVEWILFGFPAALVELLPNLLQGAAGVLFGLLLSMIPIPANIRRMLRSKNT